MISEKAVFIADLDLKGKFEIRATAYRTPNVMTPYSPTKSSWKIGHGRREAISLFTQGWKYSPKRVPSRKLTNIPAPKSPTNQ
jgi:hypothetical protein